MSKITLNYKDTNTNSYVYKCVDSLGSNEIKFESKDGSYYLYLTYVDGKYLAVTREDEDDVDFVTEVLDSIYFVGAMRSPDVIVRTVNAEHNGIKHYSLYNVVNPVNENNKDWDISIIAHLPNLVYIDKSITWQQLLLINYLKVNYGLNTLCIDLIKDNISNIAKDGSGIPIIIFKPHPLVNNTKAYNMLQQTAVEAYLNFNGISYIELDLDIYADKMFKTVGMFNTIGYNISLDNNVVSKLLNNTNLTNMYRYVMQFISKLDNWSNREHNNPLLNLNLNATSMVEEKKKFINNLINYIATKDKKVEIPTYITEAIDMYFTPYEEEYI